MPLPPTQASEWEDFDLAQMCDLLDDQEAVRLKAMSQIASAYKGPLFGFVRSKFPSFSVEDAEDIVQQTMIEFWNKVEGAKFDANGSLKSLLFTISLRKGIDELRRRTSKKRSDDDVVDAVAKAISGTDVARAWRLATGRDEQAREIMDLFREFIATLPAQQRMVAEGMYAQMPDVANNLAIIDYIRQRTGKIVTAVQIKGAKQALIDKFRSILTQKGFSI